MLPFKWILSEMSETEITFFDTKVYKGGNSCILQAFYKTKDGSFVKFWLLPILGVGLKLERLKIVLRNTTLWILFFSSTPIYSFQRTWEKYQEIEISHSANKNIRNANFFPVSEHDIQPWYLHVFLPLEVNQIFPFLITGHDQYKRH